MAKNPPAVQPTVADLNSIDFTADVTKAVTFAIAKAIADHIADSGLVSDAVNAVITRRRTAAIAALSNTNTAQG